MQTNSPANHLLRNSSWARKLLLDKHGLHVLLCKRWVHNDGHLGTCSVNITQALGNAHQHLPSAPTLTYPQESLCLYARLDGIKHSMRRKVGPRNGTAGPSASPVPATSLSSGPVLLQSARHSWKGATPNGTGAPGSAPCASSKRMLRLWDGKPLCPGYQLHGGYVYVCDIL